MAYPSKHLLDGESIVVDRHPHWWFLVPRGVLLALVTAFGAWVGLVDEPIGHRPTLTTALRWIALVAIVLALVYFLARLTAWATTSFVVTSTRCIYRAGVFSRHKNEIPLDHINTLNLNQSFFERIVGAGDLVIESAGRDSKDSFSDIRDPSGVERAIYQQIEDLKNRHYDRIGSEAREVGPQHTSAGLSVAEQLEKLEGLRDRGVISDADFDIQRDALLDG